MEVSEERKVKTVRVRKAVIDPGVNTSETRRTRKIKLAKKVSIDPLVEGPIPGSLEEDFLLENNNDHKAFLKVSLPDIPDVADFGPRYYQEGRLVPHSVIGAADLFEKQHAAEMKAGAAEEKAQPDPGTEVSPRRTMFMSLRKVSKTPSETPEQKFQLKQQKIEEGRRRDTQEESTRLQSLPVGVRLIEDRQRKCLKEFEHAQKDWEQLGHNFAQRTGKSRDSLVVNQLQDYRERLEAMEQLDRAVSMEEKAGVNGWYMSLRAGSSELRGAYLPVGNMFSGIYAQIKDRTKTPEAMIRKPAPIPVTSVPSFTPITEEEGSEKPRARSSVTTRKTFRDSAYFQRRIKEEAKKMPELVMQGHDPLGLYLQGTSKLQAELHALQKVGLDAFKPELIRAGELSPEVYAEQYDIKFKY